PSIDASVILLPLDCWMVTLLLKPLTTGVKSSVPITLLSALWLMLTLLARPVVLNFTLLLAPALLAATVFDSPATATFILLLLAGTAGMAMSPFCAAATPWLRVTLLLPPEMSVVSSLVSPVTLAVSLLP